MHSDKEHIKSLLKSIVKGQDYEFLPASEERILLFINKAKENGVSESVINQLVDLYKVTDFFINEVVISFLPCDDSSMYEWWFSHGQLLLGVRDFYLLRWTNNKFYLGDITSLAFSKEYEYDTLIELIEGCIYEIRQTQ